MPADGSTAPLAVVLDCDVAEGIPAVTPAPGVTRVLVLVRAFTEPLGLLDEALPPTGLSPGELAEVIGAVLEPALRVRLEGAGVAWEGSLPLEGVQATRTPPFLASREIVMREGPRMTIAVCTRNRPDGLADLLESIKTQEYDRVRTLVVDNAPPDERTREVVARAAEQFDVTYVREPRPGLSWARNRCVEEADGEVIAWADDDELCDRWWAAELARAFFEVPQADVVTGIQIPFELATPSQAWFESYSGVRRGRGFARTVFSPADMHRQDPLYPLPAFGVGGNMAFRREALERIGRFDCALGAGTPSMAGEDTAALSAVLLGGGTLVQQPTAMVSHRHRRDDSQLRTQMLGYGRGLTAFYTSLVVHDPRRAVSVARLAPRALRDMFAQRGRRHHEIDESFPRELLQAHRLGLLQGPFMYARSQARARRLRHATPA